MFDEKLDAKTVVIFDKDSGKIIYYLFIIFKTNKKRYDGAFLNDYIIFDHYKYLSCMLMSYSMKAKSVIEIRNSFAPLIDKRYYTTYPIASVEDIVGTPFESNTNHPTYRCYQNQINAYDWSDTIIHPTVYAHTKMYKAYYPKIKLLEAIQESKVERC